MRCYLDSSALVKLIVEEPESAALAAQLDALRSQGADLVSSMLAFTEVHCAVQRLGVPASDQVNATLSRLNLINVTRQDLLRAGTSEWRLRSADAIHLATALRVDADWMVCYDRELSERSAAVGLPTMAPGHAA